MTAMQNSLFTDPLSKLYEVQDALKEDRKMLREKQSDEPLELEELREVLKESKAQVAERRKEFLEKLMSDDVEYNEIRERIQDGKEQMAKLKAEVRLNALVKSKDEDQDLDFTVIVKGAPYRLQTQKDCKVYLNGKEIK